ncbi:MAG: hypothetical protein R3332_05930 [Pseudohongiellaceae bacterium]|nr:hypothetical protein [Pseudohongiellaceae bacterium]
MQLDFATRRLVAIVGSKEALQWLGGRQVVECVNCRVENSNGRLFSPVMVFTGNSLTYLE